jgi:hypothetical protein
MVHLHIFLQNPSIANGLPPAHPFMVDTLAPYNLAVVQTSDKLDRVPFEQIDKVNILFLQFGRTTNVPIRYS